MEQHMVRSCRSSRPNGVIHSPLVPLCPPAPTSPAATSSATSLRFRALGSPMAQADPAIFAAVLRVWHSPDSGICYQTSPCEWYWHGPRTWYIPNPET